MSKRRQIQRWSEADQRLALGVVAFHNGNVKRAASDLKAQGLPIPRTTLQPWRTTKADLYAEIRPEWLDRANAEAAERYQAIALRNVNLSEKMTERMKSEIKDFPARDLPGGIRNVATAAGIYQDKAQNLRADSQAPINLPDIEQTLRSLKASGITNIRLEMVDDEDESGEAIPSTASEIPTPRLAPGPGTAKDRGASSE